ncbi:MAG: type II secretion system F family protein [Negativicutes bacterium]|nr:type II secretion system F family protein [Negativicutes bacterium]
MVMILSILVAVGTASLIWLVFLLVAGRERPETARLRLIAGAGGKARPTGTGDSDDQPLLQRLSKILNDMAGEEIARLAPRRILDYTGRQIGFANVRGWTAERFVAASVMLGLAVGGLALSYFVLLGRPLSFSLGLAVAVGVMALIFPFAMLNSRINRRRRQIERDLPEALDLLTVSVEAGLSFDGALAKISERMQGALSEEFTRTLQGIRLGQGRRQALSELASRCHVESVGIFTAAVIQADQLGVSIGKVLRIQARTARVKKRQQVERQAMKAPLKMLFPMVLFIFPTIFIVLLGPAILQFIGSLGGR